MGVFIMYEGKLVKLRSYIEEDIEIATRFINDEEIKKLLCAGVPFPMTKWEEENWVKSRKAGADYTYDFAIENLENGKYIGGCSVNETDLKNRNCTIGIMIGDKECWSKGYGSDALNILVKFIFEELNMEKIKLCVFSFNVRAIACYKKVGFIEEGIMRKEIYRNGKYHDEVKMAMFREDWTFED